MKVIYFLAILSYFALCEAHKHDKHKPKPKHDKHDHHDHHDHQTSSPTNEVCDDRLKILSAKIEDLCNTYTSLGSITPGM